MYTRNLTHTSEMITLLKEQFKTVRQQEEITTFNQHSRDALPDTVTNRQLPTVTDTPLISKRVPYSAMTKKSGRETEIRNELSVRGVVLTDDENRNYTKIMRRLKDNEGDEKSFSPVTGIKKIEWWKMQRC